MTQLVGNSAGTPVSGVFPDSTAIVVQSYVATASGVATSASFYFLNTFATNHNFVIAVYDASNNLLATSQQGSTGTTSGLKTVSFSSGPTIVSGTTYKLGVQPDGFIDVAGTGTGEQSNSQSPVTFPTPPNPFASNNSDTPGILFITLDGTSGNPIACDSKSRATSTAALTTGISLAEVGSAEATSTAALSTTIRLAETATARSVVTVAFATGAALAVNALAESVVTAALTSAIPVAATSSSETTAVAALTNWSTVVLGGVLYPGPGSITDPLFWPGPLPTVGTTIYYDGTHITIASDGEISADTNDCQAVVQFFDGLTWQIGTVVITPFMAAYSIDIVVATAALTTTIALQAVSSARSAVTANLTGLAAALNANALAMAASVASLGVGILLLSSSSVESTVVANLAGGAVMSATAASESSSSAALTTQVSMQSAASTYSLGLASLSTSISLSETARAYSLASATFDVGAAVMSATASATSRAAAAITTQIPLQALSTAPSFALAQLSTGMPLLSAALCTAHTQALLTITAYHPGKIKMQIGSVVLPQDSEQQVTATYLDYVGVPYVPQSVRYKIEAPRYKSTVVDWTSVTPDVSNLILIGAANNLMDARSKLVEARRVTVEVTAPGNGVRTDVSYYYLIRYFG